MYKTVKDAITKEDMHDSSIGERIILPASFIPGPRYLFEKYQDTMAICRFFGYPKLFITFICNPWWTEISDALRSIKGHRPEDRPDLVSTIFQIKLQHLMNDVIKNDHFSPTKAGQLPEVQFSKASLGLKMNYTCTIFFSCIT